MREKNKHARMLLLSLQRIELFSQSRGEPSKKPPEACVSKADERVTVMVGGLKSM
jgi:hypothetical protein